MTYDEIKQETADMQAELETIIPDDVESIIERGKHIAVYIARSGHLLALSKQMVRSKKRNEIGDLIIKIAKQNYLSAKAQNALVDSLANEEMLLVDELDRINAAFTHQLDYVRSLISFEKENMRIAKTGY